jgi:hypothetical protein
MIISGGNRHGEAGPRCWSSETAGISPAFLSRPSVNATAILVATSDRNLSDRVRAAGAAVYPAERLRIN